MEILELKFMHKNKYIRIKDVNIEKKNTWQNKITVTIDVDYAADHVFEYCLDILEESKKKATIFITHETKLLERIRKNPNWELGIHPNFLETNNTSLIKNNINKILLKMKSLIPEAVSMRSHGLVTAGRWLWDYENNGIKFLSNNMKFNSINAPYYELNGIIECPIFFGDNCQLYALKEKKIKPINISKIIKTKQNELRILNFHPIHIALNTENYFRYEKTKHVHRNWKQVKDARYNGPEGAEMWFRKSLEL